MKLAKIMAKIENWQKDLWIKTDYHKKSSKALECG